MKREWDSMKHVLREEMKKRYEIVHDEHKIVVQTSLESTWLYVDGQLKDEVHRPSKLGKLRISETLKTMIDDIEVKVKIHGTTTLDCTFYINGKKIMKEKRELNVQPWRHQPILVQFVQQYDTETPLPDERYYGRVLPPLEEMWLYEEEGYEESFARKLAKKVDWLLEKPVEKTRISLYEDTMDEDFLTYAILFRDQLNDLSLDEQALYREARWFIDHAAHRYVLAFGLILLGRAHAIEKERALWTQFSTHPFFAPFVALALEGRGEEADALMFEFVGTPYEQVYLRTITPLTDDMMQYYLMEAPLSYKNTETAIAFAEKGGLYKALQANEIDDALYNRATQFLLPMLDSDMSPDEYGDFAPMTLEYVKHAKTRAVVYEQLYPIAKLHLYMKEDIEYALDMEYISVVTRNLVLSGTEAILKSADWRPAIEKAFATQRNMEEALTICRALEEDYVPLVYKKIVNGHFEPYLYEAIATSGNREMIQKTVDYVEQFELATLNPLELESVSLLIQQLDEYEGIGVKLLGKALQINEREMVDAALWTLDFWSPESYRTKEITQALTYISHKGIDRDQRKSAKALIKSLKDD